MFGTSGIRGTVGEGVTAELALSLGRAMASEGYHHVVVGRDTRTSGAFLTDAVTAGLRECGADVTRAGVVSTPTVARGVNWLDADAGIAITASHNPPRDNGFKLWTPSGKAFGADRRTALAERIESETYAIKPWDEAGSQTNREGLAGRHARELAEVTDHVGDLTVAVDVGNGTGTVTVDALRESGCTVQTLNAQPDGHFPARPSEPTAENCEALCQFVGSTDADLGIAHDGDADRMVAVTENGRFVPRDALLALFARQTATAGDSVAAPLNTSILLEDVLQDVDATLRYTKVGDVHVADQVAEPGVVFGGEPSGAWIWSSETLCPDGSLAACRLVEMVGGRTPLSALVNDLDSYPIYRGNVAVDNKRQVMQQVRQRVKDTYDGVDDRDGVRVDNGNGWFLVRASGTQPLVRVTAEARSDQRARTLFDEASALIEDGTSALVDSESGR